MKIAFFQNLPDGGALRTVYEQIKYLSRENEIDLYCFYNPEYKDLKNYIKRIYLSNFIVNECVKGFLNKLNRDFKNFYCLNKEHKKIAFKIDSNNYNLVIVHSDRWTEAPFLLKYLKTLNIYHCHELLRIGYETFLDISNFLPFHKKIYERFTRLLRKKIDYENSVSANYIITSSLYIKRKVYLAYKKNAVTIHAGVDSNIFKPYFNIKKRYILFIGKKDKVKGYDLYLKIKRILMNKNLEFVDYAVEDGQELKINDDNILSKIYSGAFCFLCLSRNEPFGLTALESMACGTPVLAVNEGGYRETVIDGVTGYLLPRKPEAFAKKILFLSKNPDIVKKMGIAGREHVKRNFTWEKHCKKLEDFIKMIVKEKKIFD